MSVIDKVLKLLSGKKATIATVLGAILVYLQGRACIAVDTAQLISIILVALGLSANVKGYIASKKVDK